MVLPCFYKMVYLLYKNLNIANGSISSFLMAEQQSNAYTYTASSLSNCKKPETLIQESMYKHLYVHCSAIYNSQDLEIAKCPSADEWKQRCGTFTHWNTTWLFEKKEILPFAK